MAAVPVRLTVRHEETGVGADSWAGAFRAPEPAIEAVAEVFGRDLDERFATRTDPWGGAWAPLSPATIEIRQQRGEQGGSLRRTRFVRMVEGGRAIIGLAASFARAFAFGAPRNKAFGRGSAPIPGRQVLPLRGRRVEPPPEVKAEVKQVFGEQLRERARRR